jgi:hypothetical protein
MSSGRRAAPQRDIEPVEFLETEEAEFATDYEVEAPRRDSGRTRVRRLEENASNVAFAEKSSQDEEPTARPANSHDNPLRIR